ncbi:MAG: DUF1579 domain-containing protein [Sphingobacteriales bacterium]|nr:DUF1579 domain-containing protein [Sphingobacteriales bacterium]
MKKIFFAATAMLLSVCTLHAQSQDEAMKAWQNFMTPGDMHKWLAGRTGTWEAEVSMWMDPAAPPTKSKSTDVVTMSPSGLFQIGNYSSTMMGMPFQGQSTLGYDNAKKKFVLSWIDNFSSGMVIMYGEYDAATKTLSLTGVQTDPVTGKDSPIRQVNVYHDEDSYTTTMYGAGMDGKEMKFMEGTYHRKK